MTTLCTVMGNLLRAALLIAFVAVSPACDGVIGEGETEYVDIEASNTTGFIRVQPYRLVDTRESTPIAAERSRCFSLGTKVPASASAVAINLTVVSPDANGFLTVYPFDPNNAREPGISTLNYTPGAVVANGAIVAVGSESKICVYSLAKAHVIVDVSGYFPTKSAYTPVTPYRRLDTREDSALSANAKRCWVVAGQNGIPKTAIGIAANLVAVKPSGPGFLTAYPFDTNNSSVPGTSSLNYAAGQVVANGGIMMLGDDGKVCVYSKAKTDVILDVTGYFGEASSYTPIAPTRVLDSRPSSEPVAESTRCVTVAGKHGIPAGVSAVAVNLTAVNPTGPGYLLARPAGNTGINTSTLNYDVGDVRANNAIVQPGAFGQICIYTKSNADYILDVVGYWPGTVNPDPIAHPHVFEVSGRTAFLNALESAKSGDRIQIAAAATIDLSNHKEIPIPGGVTIDGGRKSGTPGALIKTNERGELPGGRTWSLFRTAGTKVLVGNLRLQGPDGSIAGSSAMGGGINLRHNDSLVRGSEIYNWPAFGVSVSTAENVVVEHNYIHDNIRTGRGYGVVVNTTETPTIIRNNTFTHNRHSVAGSGYGSYEIHHNRFANSATDGVHSIIDMHGANEHALDNSTHQAGINMHIHHNDIQYTGTNLAIVGIRGIPREQAVIENNCVARSDTGWVEQWDMTAYASPQAGQSCYEKSGTWLCHIPVSGSAMKKITVRNNAMGTTASCR